MFSAVFFSRGLVNLWYGSKKKLKGVSIGTVWRAEGSATLHSSVELANGTQSTSQTPRWAKWLFALLFLFSYALVKQVLLGNKSLGAVFETLIFAPAIFVFYKIVGKKTKTKG